MVVDTGEFEVLVFIYLWGKTLLQVVAAGWLLYTIFFHSLCQILMGHTIKTPY